MIGLDHWLSRGHDEDTSPVTCFDCNADDPSLMVYRRTAHGLERIAICAACAADWPDDEQVETHTARSRAGKGAA